MKYMRWPDNDTVECECGATVPMYWNGGELDDSTCACGRHYQGAHLVTVIRVKEPGE